MKIWLLAGTAALLVAAAQPVLPVFTDITKESGITFRHSYGDHHMDNIVEGTGAGVCLFDYNNDGLLDIYFVTGTWTKGVSDNEGRDLRGKLSNRLYKNYGNGTFTTSPKRRVLAARALFSSGCSAADYDNDGFVDLYVLNYGAQHSLSQQRRRHLHRRDREVGRWPTSAGASRPSGSTTTTTACSTSTSATT